MIIVCPTCSSKYSVQDTAIDGEKMVRCPLCGTTWHPEPEIDPKQTVIPQRSNKQNPNNSLLRHPRAIAASRHWMMFSTVVLSTLTFLLLKTNYLHRIPSYIKYISHYIKLTPQKPKFALSNLSHYFTKKDDGLYLSITGDIKNLSSTSIPTPYLSVNLRTYGEEFANYETPDMFINETWAVKLDPKNIDRNQKVVFETEPRKVPMNDLMCTIKVGQNM